MREKGRLIETDTQRQRVEEGIRERDRQTDR